jgi:hypothetical protein
VPDVLQVKLERSFGPTYVHVQVKNAYRQDCLLRTSSTVVLGSPERHAEILSMSEASNRPNTAHVERLNLFLRRSCSYLHRRTSGRVRNHQRLASAVELIRCR